MTSLHRVDRRRLAHSIGSWRRRPRWVGPRSVGGLLVNPQNGCRRIGPFDDGFHGSQVAIHGHDVGEEKMIDEGSFQCRAFDVDAGLVAHITVVEVQLEVPDGQPIVGSS